MTHFKESKEWADGFWPDIERILKEQSPRMVKIKVASLDLDRNHGTDYLVAMGGSAVACRIRGADYYWKHQDIALRNSRTSGVTTEVEKLKQGEGADWYLYGWGDNGRLDAWVLIDIDRMCPLLDDPDKVISGRGGTTMLTIPLCWLRKAGAIVSAGGWANRYSPAPEGHERQVV